MERRVTPIYSFHGCACSIKYICCNVFILHLRASDLSTVQHHKYAAMHILAHVLSTQDPFVEVKSPGHREWHPQVSWVCPSGSPKWLHLLLSY